MRLAGFSTTSTQGDSLYNTLQLQLRHQFSHGLLIQASYTWSKLITNVNSPEAGGGIAAPGNVLSGSASSNDPLDLGQQYGLAAFNRPQRFILAYSYDLPYKHTQGFAGHAFGGWTVSGVTTIQDGEPLTVIDGNAGTIYYAGAAGFGGSGIRAELNPANTGTCNSFGVCQGIGLSTTGSTEFRALHGFINPAAFTSAPCIGGTVQGNCAGSGGGTGFGNSAALAQAERKAKQGGAPAYNYWFQWQTPILDGTPRAFHCSELPFVFYHTEVRAPMTGGGPEALHLAARMADAWISFARTGNPNHQDLPAWPAFDPKTTPTMIFDNQCVVKNDPDGEVRKAIVEAMA